MSMLKDFRDFAIKGNVVDLAVAVIIGAAFGKIVDSLVKDLIMPVIGAIFGGLDFTNYFIPLGTIRRPRSVTLRRTRTRSWPTPESPCSAMARSSRCC
jgi:large conductance mechanosensitive channel